MQKQKDLLKKHWLWLLTNIVALLLLVQVNRLWGRTDIEADQQLMAFTGNTALILLILSLACTPIAAIFGFRASLKVRKSLGLWGFFYGLVHLLIFYQQYGNAEWEMTYLMLQGKMAFGQAGLAALILLLPLALTSNKWAMRSLGRNWKRIHRLVYVAVPLAVVHYWWGSKWFNVDDVRNVWPYAIVVVVLLLVRVSWVRHRIRTFNQKIKQRIKPYPMPFRGN